MLTVVREWGKRYFSDPQETLLIILIAAGLLMVLTMGEILAPVIASIVIAYVLQWLAGLLVRLKMPRSLAFAISYCLFLGLFIGTIFFIWPVIWQQLLRLFDQFPSMINQVQQFLNLLPEKYPEYFTQETVNSLVTNFLLQLKVSGKALFTASISRIPGLIVLIVYFVMVPLMVFFFLKDYRQLMNWFLSFLPEKRPFLSKLGHDVNRQIGNYIRGKVAEVFILGIASYVAFYLFKLQYAALLALCVGLSVLIPYVGMVAVTIPVVIVAFFQWGLGHEFILFLITFGIINAIDGIILVPLLFSGFNSLHPLAIIVAILVFGGWWGFWGVFFAIPLATFIKAILESWPQRAQSIR